MSEEIIDTVTTDGAEQQIGNEQEVNLENSVPDQQPTPQERTFSQFELDSIIEKRLAKEKQRYESEREKASQQARDAYIAEQGYVWNGKPITTEAEYQQAMKEQELIEQYQSRGLPDEVVSELVESKKFREEYTAKERAYMEAQAKTQAEAELKARTNAMYEEFLNEFPDQNTEEAWQTIPKEVFAEADKWLKSGGREGRRLADAFIYHQRKAELQQQQIQQANSKNADNSTGSVKSSGNAGQFFTREQVANMSREEIQQNYKAIKESERHWK